MANEYVKGLDELDKILQTLPANIEGNVMRGALREGQKVFLAEARALVPVEDGDLRDSLRIVTARKSRKFGWIRVHLKAGNKTAWYAHLVKFGTASYYTGKGRTVGKPYKIKPRPGKKALLFGGKVREVVTHSGIKPSPFMRRAVDRGQGRAIAATVAYLRRRIPREVKRHGP